MLAVGARAKSASSPRRDGAAGMIRMPPRKTIQVLAAAAVEVRLETVMEVEREEEEEEESRVTMRCMATALITTAAV